MKLLKNKIERIVSHAPGAGGNIVRGLFHFIQSTGTPRNINISGATYAFVEDFFGCEFRGKVQAKNKGEINMYYVNGLKIEYSKDGDEKTANGIYWKEVYGR